MISQRIPKALLITLVLILICSACTLKQQAGKGVLDQTPGSYIQTLDVNGLERTYLLHLPACYSGEGSLPLVMMFHGGGGF